METDACEGVEELDDGDETLLLSHSRMNDSAFIRLLQLKPESDYACLAKTKWANKCWVVRRFAVPGKRTQRNRASHTRHFQYLFESSPSSEDKVRTHLSAQTVGKASAAQRSLSRSLSLKGERVRV